MFKFKNMLDFAGIKIKLASPEEILSWSNGEVLKPETINYRSWRPEKDGLFCEKIFGPSHDYECYCGKYKKIRFKGVICDKCGVEVTTSKVRRERMGHISLAAPIVHLWYLRNTPSPISVILDVPQKELESVVYFTKYLVTTVNNDKRKEALLNLETNSQKRQSQIDVDTKAGIEKTKTTVTADNKELKNKIKNPEQLLIAQKERDVRLKQDIQKLENKAAAEKNRIQSLMNFLEDKIKSLQVLSVLTDEEEFYLAQFKANIFYEAKMGAESLLEVLSQFNLPATVKNLKKELAKTSSKLKKKKIMYKIRILNGMISEEINPAWVVLRNVPVIPPDLRPMVQLTGGRFATSDLNDLYRRLINRNNRLKKLIKLGAPEIILRNEKRMLQESVDILIDAQKSAKNKRKNNAKRLPRSLSDLLRSKKGRFRRNLLGKRVDYSGRSVVVVGPELKLNQVGLPKEIALEMYRPFVLRELMNTGLAANIKSAKNLIDHRINEVYDILERVTKNTYVLLNRAPTLHKLSIQAFKPILVDGLAIRIHPCVCKGFNADFDGDQMGVHLPLSELSQKEARRLMLPSHNLLKPADGSPISIPSQEMAVGCYYITSVRTPDLTKVEGTDLKGLSIMSDPAEVTLAYQSKKIELRELIVVRYHGKLIKTTYGRLWFNSVLPSEFEYINEPLAGSKALNDLIVHSLEIAGRLKTVKLIDSLKDIGFAGFTLSGLSLSMADCGYLPQKDKIILAADKKIAEINDNFKMGLISNEERKRLCQSIWMEVTEDIAEKTWATLSPDSPIRVVSAAGIKRASKDQIKQLSGMRGLMVDPTGKIVQLPTKSNFREGLSVFEYITGARGTRKGLADTALRTADAGYLTRRLVDCAHVAITHEDDCGTTKFWTINRNEKGREKFFGRRLLGRVLGTDVTNPKGKVIVKKGTLINNHLQTLIENSGVNTVEVRSPLTCRSKYGLCRQCYGWDLSNRKLVKLGVPVGVIAAQSIGEPGTQLTLRTKHTGGVLGIDVTQGLPRVQELFEVRTPKLPSPLSEIGGKIKIKESVDGYELKITGKDKNNAAKTVTYMLPSNVTLLVSDGDLIVSGTQLCSGPLDVREILEVNGLESAQKYLINSIQGVYESQGIAIHDKHLEVIVKEMSDKLKIEDPGDTNFLYGQIVTRAVYQDENDQAKAKPDGKIAKGKKVLLGLIQSSLTTGSWLSAASFQQTTSVLTEASLLGEVDHLIGLKENVIIGRLIPVGKDAKIQ
jgi:DNA-directed RNA polymerase subunit beta'